MTPDPFKRAPNASAEDKQGAAGCFILAAWFLALPVALVLWVFVAPALAIGVMLGLVIVGYWLSSKAKGGGSGTDEGVPDSGVPDADPAH